MTTTDGSKLIVSNRTENDIILRNEFEAMDGLDVLWTLTDDPGADGANIVHERIGKRRGWTLKGTFLVLLTVAGATAVLTGL